MRKWLAVAGFALAGGGGLAAWTAMPSEEGGQTADKVSVQFEDYDDTSADREAPTQTDRKDERQANSSDSQNNGAKADETPKKEPSKMEAPAETEVTVLGIERDDDDRAEDSAKRVAETPEPSHEPMNPNPVPTTVEDELSSTVDVSRLNHNVHSIPENFGGLKKGQLKVRNNAGQKKPNK
jgi:hypothetical protein